MPADMPPVPPAVIEFAEKNNIVDVKPHLYWDESEPYKGYRVYYGHAKDDKENGAFILVNDKEIREPSHEEIEEIIEGRVYL